MKKWRFLNSGFSDCYTNMAVDEAMLVEYEKGLSPEKVPTLRIYGWKPKAFSLGYSQDPAQELDLAKCQKDNISFVRRVTGGGVIFHNQELTYSLVCSQNDINASANVKETFRIISSFLLNTYRRLGLKADFAMAESAGGNNNWFCFAEREKYDILIEGRKIGGNAQRRKKDIIFQHGSIPLKSDIEEAVSYLKKRPKDITGRICSLSEALKREIGFAELRDVITDLFKETFSVTLSQDEIDYAEKELSEKLKAKKYKLNNWNFFKNADIDSKAKVA